MPDPDDQTDRDIQLNAFRGAVAMALASHRGDREGVSALLYNAEHKPELIAELAALPAALAYGVAQRHGEDLDIEAALGDLLLALPQTIDTPEEEA